jgi:hypothetical protein
MATKDFVSDFGAPTDGSSSCASAVAQWRTWITAHPGDTLTIPAHVYQLEFGLLVGSDPNGHTGNFPDTNVIPSCTITGAGSSTTKIKSWAWVGTQEGSGSAPHFIGNIDGGGFINTCYIGGHTVTLKDAGDLSKFAVGDWINVCGICLQDQSGPPNFQRYEFHQITNISGSVLTLDSPLRYSYSDTWPNSFDVPTTGGAACIYSLGPPSGATGCYWDANHSISGIHFMCSDDMAHQDSIMNSSGVITTPPSHNAFVFNPIRTLNLTDCIFDGFPPGVSWCETGTFTDCTMTAITAEIDKCNTTLIYDGCTVGHLQIQSASPEFLIARNGCVFTAGFSSDGTGKNCTISDSDITGTFNTGPGFGRSDSLVITNTTINNTDHYPDFSGHGVNSDMLPFFTYLGDGLLLYSTTDFARALNFQQSVIPGFQYAFAFQNDIYPDPQFTTPPIYFCVTDISEAPPSGGNYFNMYVQTDMAYVAAGTDGMDNFPTATFNTHAWNQWQAIPFKTFTIDGVNQVAVQPRFIATTSCPVVTDGSGVAASTRPLFLRLH